LGRADPDAVVMPMETIYQQDVPPVALDGRLGAQVRNRDSTALPS
jgi:hypothetical protein